MLDYTKYENKIPFPMTSSQSIRSELKKLLNTKDKGIKLSQAQELRLKELEIELKDPEEAKKIYREEDARLYDLWKSDLFKAHVKDEKNPKLSRCFSLAYEYGHSSGLCDVENYFIDLVDLIQD